MYHCRVKIYFACVRNDLYETIKEMAPLEHFQHEFTKSDEIEETFAADADVIIAECRGAEIKTGIAKLFSCKKEEADLILIADKEQIPKLAEEDLLKLADIWTLPLTEGEIRFRFRKWQQDSRVKTDLWQSRSYLDAAINSVPHLIWFKDKEGVHKKVNRYFCKAVNKTMEQIEGRGHYYIWDLTPDEYAKGEFICMESEYEVMEKRKTCIFDEKVKIGDDMRQLKTYKTPLFDLDGSVMGTVGVATDVTQERIYEQMIVKNANTDFLTGLYNRRYVSDFIKSREDGPLTVYYLDLDNFKKVNDRYGHHVGDDALVLTAETLRKCMPDGVIARFGGDEFLVIETGAVTEQEAEEKRRWLQEQLDNVYQEVEHFHGISASIGTAHSAKGKDVMDALIKDADAFMYRVKNQKKHSLSWKQRE